MNWPLIAVGVMAGVGLVVAKQLYDGWIKGRERKARYRRQVIESASVHATYPHRDEPPQASVAAGGRAAPVSPAASGTPVAEAESPTEDAPDAGAAVSKAGDAASALEPDVEVAAKRDTEASRQPDAVVSGEPEPGASPKGASDDKRVEEALASGDLSLMETVLQESDDPIHRNLLLNRLVAGHYRLRSEPEHREAFYRLAHAQTDEASTILNAFEAVGRPRPDHIEAFKSIAIALDEDKRYDEAMAICDRALSLGLEDGTKTGFKGRIARLKRSRDSKS